MIRNPLCVSREAILCLLALLVIDGSTDAADGATPDELNALRARIEAATAEFESWGLRIAYRSAKTEANADYLQSPLPDSLSVDDPKSPVYYDRCIVDRGRFRYERKWLPEDSFSSVSDGRNSRFRSRHESSNYPSADAIANLPVVPPNSPHAIHYSWMGPTDMQWAFGGFRSSPFHMILDAEDALDVQAVIRLGGRFGLSISEGDWRGHDCFRVSWESNFGMYEDDWNYTELWLAKERSLLPVRHVRRSTGGVAIAEITEFQKRVGGEDWLPRRIVGYDEVSPDAILLVAECEQIPAPFPDSEFAAAAPLSNKPGFSLTQPDGRRTGRRLGAGHPIDPYTSTVQTFRSVVLVSAVMGLVVLGFLVPVVMRRTSRGRRLREFALRHTDGLSWLPLVFAVVVFAATSFVPGWSRLGLAMMGAGLAGVCGTLGLMMLLGQRSLSIRSMLWLCLAISLVFAGFSTGINRFQARQRMIDQVSVAGGIIGVTNWDSREERLYLPDFAFAVLGQGYTGHTNYICIPSSLATRANFRSWPFDEIHTMTIESLPGEDNFVVDETLITEIGRSSRLDSLKLIGGNLSRDCYATLKRLPGLKTLHLDCCGGSIAPELASLRNLDELRLDNALVDERFVNTLTAFESTPAVTLMNPVFDQIPGSSVPQLTRPLYVESATVSADGMNALGRLATKLVFFDCVFSFSDSDRIELPATQSMLFASCGISDREFVKLDESPRLIQCDLRETSVTCRGLDAFSIGRPDVHLRLTH